MNDFDSGFDIGLGRLLDNVADAYRPKLDPARLRRGIAARRRHGMGIMVGKIAGGRGGDTHRGRRSRSICGRFVMQVVGAGATKGSAVGGNVRDHAPTGHR